MRCLNKIVFINSANIPYAEIHLDGNVHFIGTQGVGKSTILRAILFFYNADKLKLGIPKEKKGFDDFYLPHSNSYIIYELTHERGDFCVLLQRSQGRACYRFFDGRWDRSLLIDDKGEVTSEYTVLRKRLGSRSLSRLVDKYDEFRNIIYGNHRASSKEFYNYAIMESPAYQNIPRSLQNVFLNSRVDADFIKEIILRSMSDEIPSIDLGYYRRQVADFQTEYENISIWFRKNAHGVIQVRENADKVIELYRQLGYLRSRIEQSYAELLYADRTNRERLPELESKKDAHLQQQHRYERLIAEQNQKLEKEKEDINKAIGEVESKQKDCRSKRKDYESKNIEVILERASHEEELKLALGALQKKKEVLTQEHNSLNAKYIALEDSLRGEFREHENLAKDNMTAVKEQHLSSKQAIGEKAAAALSKLREEHEQEWEQLSQRHEELQDSRRQLDSEFVHLQYYNPCENEIAVHKQAISELERSSALLEAELKSLDLEISKLTSDYENRTALLTAAYESEIKELDKEIAHYRDKINGIDTLLARASGSLYEWLDGRMPGWEKSIGKVIDQDRILYSKTLKPALASSQCDKEAFFGLKLDLSGIESNLRTPKQLAEEKEMYQQAIADINETIGRKRAECDKKIKELSDTMSPKMKGLRQKRSETDLTLRAVPSRLKVETVKLQELEDRQEKMRASRKAELDERKMQLAARQLELDSARKLSKQNLEKKQKELERDREQRFKALDIERDASLKNITDKLAQKRSAMDIKLGELKARRDEELKGAGVDILALNECEQEMKQCREQLAFIDNNRSLCIAYLLDKKELFDREEEFKQQHKELETKKGALLKKYEKHLSQLTEKLNSEKTAGAQIAEEIEQCRKGFEKLEQFRASELFPAELQNTKESCTMQPALVLLEEIHNSITQRIGLRDKFKKAVNVFKADFGQGNIFNFKTVLNTDKEYMDYAADLEEFVAQDKIDDYRGRTSDRYLEILQRLSREMGELSGYSSEVEKIIREINYDFKEKNFVGAIRSIEIRSSNTGDKMVQLLQKIKEFTDENEFQMGEANIFSEESGRYNVNREAVRYLEDFMNALNASPSRQSLLLSDTFQLQFRVIENDNDTGWVEKIANVGSDGTDILVKAMVNIMLINVFKEKVSRKFGEFRIHCMMDEIGKLHPNNIKGILNFANSRNILLINSSPTTYNVSDYRYTYLLSKDAAAKTLVQPLITRKEAALGNETI
ncbi:MAG: ATP-binding protein [Candidatus Cryptobacteroides sp.]